MVVRIWFVFDLVVLAVLFGALDKTPGIEHLRGFVRLWVLCASLVMLGMCIAMAVSTTVRRLVRTAMLKQSGAWRNARALCKMAMVMACTMAGWIVVACVYALHLVVSEMVCDPKPSKLHKAT